MCQLAIGYSFIYVCPHFEQANNNCVFSILFYSFIVIITERQKVPYIFVKNEFSSPPTRKGKNEKKNDVNRNSDNQLPLSRQWMMRNSNVCVRLFGRMNAAATAVGHAKEKLPRGFCKANVLFKGKNGLARLACFS